MKTIPLTRNKITFIDDEDYELVSKYKWLALKSKKSFYAATYITIGYKQKQCLLMHHLILNVDTNQMIDHKNNDSLDNRKQNLRFCTNQQNQQNQKPRGGSSKYKGVTWHKRVNKWSARISLDGTTYNLGYFDNEENASLAYDLKAIELFGDFAKTNLEDK